MEQPAILVRPFVRAAIPWHLRPLFTARRLAYVFASAYLFVGAAMVSGTPSGSHASRPQELTVQTTAGVQPLPAAPSYSPTGPGTIAVPAPNALFTNPPHSLRPPNR